MRSNEIYLETGKSHPVQTIKSLRKYYFKASMKMGRMRIRHGQHLNGVKLMS